MSTNSVSCLWSWLHPLDAFWVDISSNQCASTLCMYACLFVFNVIRLRILDCGRMDTTCTRRLDTSSGTITCRRCRSTAEARVEWPPRSRKCSGLIHGEIQTCHTSCIREPSSAIAHCWGYHPVGSSHRIVWMLGTIPQIFWYSIDGGVRYWMEKGGKPNK